MRYQTFSVAVVLAAAWTFPSAAAAQSKEFNETVALVAGGRLSVEGDKGSISVTAWERDQVEIRARIEPPRDVSDDYARRAVEATTVDVTTREGVVRVRSNYDDVPRRSLWSGGRKVPYIHYEIQAPRSLSLSVKSDRGSVALVGFEGKIELDADRGDVELRALVGEIRIDVDRAGELEASSIRGSFDVEADRSDIRMRDVSIERDSRLRVDRGDIAIDLDESQQLTLRTRLSSRAHFDSELPVTMSSMKGRDLDGTINGGGPELFIALDRGSVRLRAAP